jgi:ribosomal protein S18 acetylase RimI-like enzyme
VTSPPLRSAERPLTDVGVALRPFSPDELDDWLESQSRGYVEERITSGESRPEAEANAAHTLGRLFPGGRPVAGQTVGAVVHEGRSVGALWVGPAGSDPRRWWVWDVAIDAEHRGRGLGRATMLLAEQLAMAAGATYLGLNVFGHNTVARQLYASLGYEEAAVQMHKMLPESRLQP